MINRKKIRGITGYTHQRQLKNADSWYKGALSFHESAIVLYEAKERITEGFRVFIFNAALSIELILKGIITAKNKEIKHTHSIKVLAKDADIELNDNQICTLDLLTDIIMWLGRYPAPKTEEQWDKFHDTDFEKHIIRSKTGNTTRTMAHPERFPNLDNYMKIWEVCLTKYKESIK